VETLEGGNLDFLNIDQVPSHQNRNSGVSSFFPSSISEKENKESPEDFSLDKELRF
jgi:hypothetical protein